MSRVLVIAEHDGETLNISTARSVTCAAAIGGTVDVAVLGQGIDAVATQAGELEGVTRVLAVNGEHLAAPLAVNWADEIVALGADYSHIIGPSTTFGRDLMPRVAALLGVNQVSDVMDVMGPTSFRRPIYAGNAIIDVETPAGAKVVATVRTASWKAAASGASATLENLDAT